MSITPVNPSYTVTFNGDLVDRKALGDEGAQAIKELVAKAFPKKTPSTSDKVTIEIIETVTQVTIDDLTVTVEDSDICTRVNELCQAILQPEKAVKSSGHSWTRLSSHPSVVTRLFHLATWNLFASEDAEDKISLASEYPTLESPDKPDEGKTIISNYDGRGTETIDRIDTLKQYRSILDQEIKNLEENHPESARLIRAKKEREKLKIMINDRQSVGQQTTWVKSQDFRDLCKKTDFETASNVFSRGVPVNLRIQNMEDEFGKTIGQIGRLGAITDVTNGWYSIEELQEMLITPNLFKTKTEEIEDYINNPKPSSLFAKLKQKLFGTKPSLSPNQSESAAKASLLLKEAYETNGAKAKEMIAEREENLERQMLQYLMEQVKANQDNIQDDKAFNLFQLSALNLKKNALDSSGWKHDEGVAFKDFRYIMQQFDGKEIKFADDGPRVEGNQVILPKSILDKEPPMNAIKLNAFIFNVSPQGNTKNDGLQKEHNDQELKRLRDIYSHIFEPEEAEATWNDLVYGTSSGYDLAERFGLILHDFAQENGALGMNCASGKDRTGFVAARLMQRKLSEVYPDNPHGRRILNPDSTATRIARDNVPKAKALKIHPLTALKKGLPGCSRANFLVRVLPLQLTSTMAT